MAEGLGDTEFIRDPLKGWVSNGLFLAVDFEADVAGHLRDDGSALAGGEAVY